MSWYLVEAAYHTIAFLFGAARFFGSVFDLTKVWDVFLHVYLQLWLLFEVAILIVDNRQHDVSWAAGYVHPVCQKHPESLTWEDYDCAAQDCEKETNESSDEG